MSRGKSNEKSASRPTLDFAKPEDPNSRERKMAEAMLRPTVGAALTVCQFNKVSGELPLTELVQELTQQIRACANGDLSRGEGMLTAQAHSLDAIFNELARRAQLNVGHYPETVERYMRLALKAQSQCRATIEALANMKNPRPVAYVQQANIGQAVQVNNAPQQAADGVARARESEKQPNKLLEQQRNEWMDGRTAQAAGSGNSSMETVGAVHGAKDARG